MYSIECIDLKKKYKKDVLKGVNIKIEKGDTVGLLGKNGAGKTTLNRIISGLAYPTSGKALVNGDYAKCGNGFVSYLSENIAIYPHLSAYDNLRQIYYINNIKPSKKGIETLLDVINIENKRKAAKHFSLGMKRRLQIAMSVLVTSNDCIILDEPTNGLDINGVIWLKKLIEEMAHNGKTIVLSSHAISDLEEVLSKYIILNNGIITKRGNTKGLGINQLDIKVRTNNIKLTKNLLNSLNCEYTHKENEFIVKVKSENEVLSIIKHLNNSNITPISYSSKKTSLVDVFINEV